MAHPSALGVVGTAVLDEIFPYQAPQPRGRRGVASLGGILYSLHALAGLAPDPGQVAPALKLGTGGSASIRSALTALGLDLRFLRNCRASQNRVELRYTSADRRREILRGGVPPSTLRDLASVLDEVSFLYLNFVAGNELTLETLRRLRARFAGPIYADLHSLFLGRRASGLRYPRALPDWREWVACCDVLQCNEHEAALLCGRAPGDGPAPDRRLARLAAEVLGIGPRLVMVTAGPRPVRAWRRAGSGWSLSPPRTSDPKDPTGCGDVLGGAFCALHYLRGLPARSALRRAVDAAARAARRVGSDGLAGDLRAWYLGRHR